MKSLSSTFRAQRLLCAAVLMAALTPLTSVSARAADKSALAADKALMAAFEKDDRAAVNKFLDADFTWVDPDGIMVTREDALALKMKPMVGQGKDIQVRENKVGDQVDWLHVNSGDKFAGRVWVKRAGGWKLLHTTEIVKHPPADEILVRPSYAIPCTNPCQIVPFRPADQVQAAVLAAWQEQVTNREQLIRHTDDEQVMVTNYLGETLPRKVRLAGPGQPSSGPPVGSPPVLWMRMWTFGPDTVVMLACQPSYGGKAYWSSRVFHFQHGLWQMMESYHNTIQASGVMTEVQGK
jgi:hypothetical protein